MKQRAIKIPDDIWQVLTVKAKELGISRSAYVRIALVNSWSDSKKGGGK